jgi:uncharacterized protein YcbX
VIVRELWRYPVKSLGGERLGRAAVDRLGFDGDRRWGLVDLDTGNVLTARREPRLLFAAARLTGDGAGSGVEVILPDGSVAAGDDDLSRWLGRPVALRAAGDTGGTYESPLDAEQETGWVSWQGPAEAWHDSARARVSLVSTATIGTWDVRRFRPNVLLDGAGEDALVGRRLRLGTAVLDVRKQIDRCVMVTRPQPGLERDLDVLRTINRERATFLAVGALVAEAGTVAVGDRLD